jgi:hypothetical protein
MAKKNSTKQVSPPSKDFLANQALIKGLSQEGIKEGNIIDPEFVKARAEIDPQEYEGVDRDYAPLPYKYFDKYESYIDPGTLRGGQFDAKELNKLRANNQSNWEQLGNATGRIALNIVPQIIGGTASMLDFQGYFDAEHAANNSIVNWADGIKKTVDEDWLPIYEDSPNKSMQMGDWAWWMSRGSGLVESVGSFLAQGFGVGKLVSAGVKGLGTLKNARNLAKAVTGLEISADKGLKAANAIGTLTSATMLNQSEAVIEATQVYQSTLDKALERGEPYEDARLKASKAAATTMNLNRLNIALNLTSAKAFMNPMAYTRQLLEKGGIGAALGELAKEGSQEALEELVNHVASKKGTAVGENRAYGWTNAINDVASMEGMEAAFLGAIGGIAQTGGTTALQYSKYGPGSTTDESGNRISLKTKQRNDYEKQQEIIKEMEASGVKMTDTMQNVKDRILFEEKVRKAAETGNQEELDKLFNQRFEQQAVKAFQSGTTEVLENLYKEEAQQDPNEVGQDHIDRANKNIKNLRTLEEIYNNYEGYNNVEDILMNRANKMRADEAYNEADTLKKNSDVDLGLQVREIAKKYNYEHDQEYINKEEGTEVSRGTRKITSPLTYSMSNLEENTGTTEHNKEVYNQFLKEVEALPSYQASKAYSTQIDELNKLRIDQDKELSNLTSKEYQAKVAAQKEEKQKVKDLKTAVDSAQSISEVEKLKEQSENEEFQKIADAKIESLKTVAAENAKAKKVNLIIAQTKDKIKKLTLEDDTDIAEEIEQLEIPEDQKQILREALYNHTKKLEGVILEEEEDIEEDPFSAFEQGEEGAKESIKKEEESFETEIPKDFPNPNTEGETVEQEVAENAKTLIQQDKTTIEGQDTQGNLIYNYDRTSEGYNKGAFLSREFNQTDDQGVINREDFTDKVEDNLDILDPDKYNEGEELTLDIDFGYEGEKYDPNSTTREKISWLTRSAELNDLAKERGVPIYELPEYIAEVPIVVRAKDGTDIFYVHDNSWYKAENLNATAEEIAEDKARNYKIRETVVKKGVVKSKISYKSYGRLFKTADGKKLSLSEAMPDPNLTIAVGKNGTFELSKSLPTETINGKSVKPKIIGNAPIQEGRPYAIVRVARGVYMPIPVQRSAISEQVANTVIFAIEAYLANDPDNQTVKNIYNATGYNINEITGLKMYLNQFIYLYPVKNETEFENILIQAGQGGALKSNMPLVAFTGNSIMFGKPGVNMGVKANKKAGVISRNFDSRLGVQKLKTVILNSGKVLSSVSISDLQLNKNTALILNKEGDTQTVNYKDHVKASTETNTLSVNIGTEQEPKWVYTIQPTVLFDTSFAGIDSSKKLRAFKPTQKVAPTTTPTTTTDAKADIEAKKAEIEKAQRQLDNVESRLNPNAKHPLFNVGQKHNVGNNYEVREFTDERKDTTQEGVEVITKIHKPAEVDADGKMSRRAEVEVTFFDSYEQAQEFVNAQYNKYKTLAEEKLANANSELAALERQLAPAVKPQPTVNTAEEIKKLEAEKTEKIQDLLSIRKNKEAQYAQVKKEGIKYDYRETLKLLSIDPNTVSKFTPQDIVNKLIKDDRILPTDGDSVRSQVLKVDKTISSLFSKLGLDKSIDLTKLNREDAKKAYLQIFKTISPYLVNTTVYSYKDNLITSQKNGQAFAVNEDVFLGQNGGLNLQTLVHELLHVVTSRGLTQGTEQYDAVFDKRINDLFEIAKNNISSKDYGLTNKFELIAEAFSNPVFAAKLAEIKTTNADKTESNLFKDILNSIVQFFKNSFNINVEKTLLNELIDAVGLHIETKGGLYSKQILTQEQKNEKLKLAQEELERLIKDQNAEIAKIEQEYNRKIAEVKTAQQPVTPPISKPSPLNLDIKIADIERRRQNAIEYNKGAQPVTEEDYKEWDKNYILTEEDKKTIGTYYFDLDPESESDKDLVSNIKSIQEGMDLINAKYNRELAVLKQQPTQPTQPVQEPTAEEEVEETLVDRQAKEFLENTPGVSEENLVNIYNGITANEESEERIPDEILTQIGFESREDATNVLTRALEIFRENAKETKTITLPNGQKITVDKNTKDSNDISDDEEDYSLPSLETPIEGKEGKTYLDKINDEVEDLVIRGIDPSTQESLLTYLAADIMQQAIDAKEVGGKKSVDTKPIFDKHLQSLKELAKFYKENGLPNKAKRLDAVIDQFDKVKRLTNQKISLFTTGTVQEDLNLDDSESSVGLEKVIYSDDWAFTVDSKSTASADLKKFFAFIQAQDENGPVTNMLGFPEIMSFDVVYNTLHEILANKPADFDFMMDTLGLYTEKFPWISGVIDKIENAPEKIQNEFVSDMAKHHIDMEFVMWSKDKNGNYSLQRWSSNASSIEQRLRQIWKSNLKGVTGKSNVVTVDPDGNYVFNKAEVERLTRLATEFAANPDAVTNDDLANWLGSIGIVLTDDTYQDLRDGKFNNRGKKSWKALFTNSDGLIKVLAKELKSASDAEVLIEEVELLNDSVVKSLAKLDAMNNMNTFSNSFQAGGKTIYSYGNNNFLVNRIRDLIAYNEVEGKFINQGLIDALKNISFTKNSLWLNELTNEDALGDTTRNTLNVGYLSLEALKKKYTQSQDNRKLNKLTASEHEVTKIGLFQNRSGKILNNQSRRVVDFFYPTMSDKSTMLTLRALAYEYKQTNGEISDENIDLLYTAIVEPELNRIRDKQANNIKGYEPNYFFFLPGLNTLPVVINDVEKTYLDLAKDKDDAIYSKEAKEAVRAHIKEIFNQLVENKLADWKSLNIGQTVKDSRGRIVEQHSFLDKEYMKHVAQGKLDYAVGDYVFNYLIANAEACKLFAGDPALYGKFNPNNTLEENLLETFTNMGKRLAGDIAPGLELANSTNNTYYQVFLKDKAIDSNNLKDPIQKEFFTKIIDTYGKDYGKIEGSDAQEYTTWKEHLFVMKQLGRLTDRQFDLITKKLTSQSLEGPKKANKLTFEEMQIVLQPMKPVYVGNSLDQSNNVDKRLYVKSSSFPLIPELTNGFQIEKIRKALEEFEASKEGQTGPDGQPLFVRASFGTANKVGAVKTTANVFDDNGNVVDNFKISDDNSLIVERKNFRIQQDVPYKREKDNINIGTQARVLLFGDLLDLQVEPGVTGQDLLNSYEQDYEDLFKYSQEKLAKRLGLTEEVTTGEDLSPLTVIPETNLVSEVETFDEELKKIKSPVAKIQKQEEFADKIGKDNLERINFINKNFDNIVKALAEGKVNIFFDENDQFKKCD